MKEELTLEEAKTLDPETIVEIEVQSTCANLQVRDYLIEHGTNRYDVLAGDLTAFESKIEHEPDIYEEVTTRQSRLLKTLRKQLTEAYPGDEQRLAAEEAKLRSLNNIPKLFRETSGRDPLPLQSLKVIKTKGLKRTPENIRRMDAQNTNQLFAQLIDRLTSNQDPERIAEAIASALNEPKPKASPSPRRRKKKTTEDA
ncbi:MAG: hypothetical protein RLP02_17935 [Coleofasciculus sp. C2-GNP5-27]